MPRYRTSLMSFAVRLGVAAFMVATGLLGLKTAPAWAAPDALYAGECDIVGPLALEGEAVLSPGRYCGGIMLSNADVVFNPGVYTIDGGDLSVSGISRVEGDGVTFIFEGVDAEKVGELHLSELTENHLRPAASGDYSGVLVLQRRAAEFAGNVQ